MAEWLATTDERAYRGGAQNVKMFNDAIVRRRDKYPVGTRQYEGVIGDLNEHGFAVLRNAVDKNLLLKLKEEFDSEIEKGSNLKEMNSHFAVVDQPLLHCPTAVELAFSDIVQNISSEYFQCTPSVGTFNLRRSYVNQSGPIKHQIFHSDPNSIKFIKFFFYLNDVGPDDGPFSIVRGSLNKKFNGWLSKYRWSEEEMKAIYGEDSIAYATGKLGDLFIANTTAFHRGVPPINNDRTMLTLNYVIHPEDWKQPTFKMKSKDYDNLPEDKKPMADFLIKV